MAALDDLTNAGLPIPSIYTSEAASADEAYQKALAAIGSKQAQLAQQFGFAIQADPNTGALQDTRIDPNQQFSQVMNLLNSHSQGLHNLRESLAGAGLTGGGMKGLAAQRAALLRFQQQGQVAGLGSNFAGQYGDLTNQRAGALATRNQGYNQAAQDAINFAIQNGWFNQAAPASSGGGSDIAPSNLPLPPGPPAPNTPQNTPGNVTPNYGLPVSVSGSAQLNSTPVFHLPINVGGSSQVGSGSAPVANRSGQTARNSF